MLVLITGTPGAGKTALAVEKHCIPVPGSFVTADSDLVSHGVKYRKGDRVPRHLFSNVKGLLVDHTPIDDEAMATWHQWAQAGDVIVYDEAQGLWRPRALGKDVPEPIKAIETHRHMGVDLVLVTQHQMLLDQNIRRLVNQHFHVRRVNSFFTILYEWDCCGEIGKYRTCVGRGSYRLKKSTFAMYESASLHTKPTQKLSPVLLVMLLLGLSVAGYFVPTVYARIANRAEDSKPATVAKAPAKAASAPVAAVSAPMLPLPLPMPVAPAVVVEDSPSGCAMVGPRCRCYSGKGAVMKVDPAVCLEAIPQAVPGPLPPSIVEQSRPLVAVDDRDLALAEYSAARARGLPVLVNDDAPARRLLMR